MTDVDTSNVTGHVVGCRCMQCECVRVSDVETPLPPPHPMDPLANPSDCPALGSPSNVPQLGRPSVVVNAATPVVAENQPRSGGGFAQKFALGAFAHAAAGAGVLRAPRRTAASVETSAAEDTARTIALAASDAAVVVRQMARVLFGTTDLTGYKPRLLQTILEGAFMRGASQGSQMTLARMVECGYVAAADDEPTEG